MRSSWELIKIEDIAARHKAAMATGPFGSSISAKYFTDSGIPVVRGSNLSTEVSVRLIDDGLVFVSPDKAMEFQRSIARRGDLIFTCWGTINQVGLVDETAKYDQYVVSNKQMKVTLDTSRADPRFIYYVFSSPSKQAEILETGIGSSVPGFNLGQLRAHQIWLPPLDEQKAIAAVLKRFDDRIDLLRDTNSTLESIARTVFKSWFIDFEPVRTKAEGRTPEAMKAPTASLFPDRMDKSPFGPLPAGWRIGKLGDVCANPRGQAKPGDMPPDTPYIGLEHMPRKSVALDSAGTAEGLESGKFWFERDDVLFGKLRPYFHKVGLAPFRGVCSTDILVLRPTEPKWLGFVAMHASSDELISYTTQLSNGARMPRTSWHDVAAFKVAIPSDDIANAFNDLVRPLFQRIYANIATAKLLAELRDTLLPRLISGKLRLPDCQEELREMIA